MPRLVSTSNTSLVCYLCDLGSDGAMPCSVKKTTIFAMNTALFSTKYSATSHSRGLLWKRTQTLSTCGTSDVKNGEHGAMSSTQATTGGTSNARRPDRIGNSYSVTALHKDNYENIYIQIQGAKHFVLLPPHCQPCVNEKPLRPATYARKESHELELVMDSSKQEGEEEGDVPFATWDPDRPDENATPYSKLAEPMRVTLEEGDMLYLPAMW